MTHYCRRSWTAAVVALALLLTVRAEASSDPADVVRALYTHFTAGDVRAASALWTAEEAPAFVRTRARSMRQRCRRLERLDVKAVSSTPDTAVYETAATWSTWSGWPGAAERVEQAHSRITLRREGETWRIRAWDSREAELVERMTAAANAADRARLLAAAPELHTTALVAALVARAATLSSQSRYDVAQELSIAAVDIAARLADPAAYSIALTQRAWAARVARPRQLDLALTLGSEAIAIGEALHDPDVFGRAHIRHARTMEDARTLRNMDPVIPVIELADYIEDAGLVAHAATHVARFLDSQGEHREAFVYAETAGKYAEESGEATARIGAALNLGSAYAYTGDTDLALRYFGKAAEIAEEANFANALSGALGVSASILAERNPREGLVFMNRAIARMEPIPAARRGLADMLQRRFLINMHLHHPDEAERDYRRSLELSPPDSVSKADLALFDAEIKFARQDYAGALALSRSAMGTANTRDARFAQALSLRCLGETEEATRLMEDIVAEINASQSSISDPDRKVFLGDKRSDAHRTLLNLFAEQGQTVRALEVAEQMKARTLRQSLLQGPSTEEPLTGAELARERSLNRRVVQLTTAVLAAQGTDADAARVQLADARADLADFRQRLFVTRPALRAQHFDNHPLTDVPAALGGVTVVEYLVDDEKTFVFVSTPLPDGTRQIRMEVLPISEPDLRLAVERFTTAVEARSRRAAEFGDALYQRILAPIAPWLAEAKAICFIPHDQLWRVPFQALGPRDGPLLVDLVPVFYAPSIAVLAAATERPSMHDTAHPALLALANPMVSTRTATLYHAINRDASLGPIPETETEVRAIARLYGKEHSRVFVGDEAREAVVKSEAAKYDILHIAAHGVIDEAAPMFSSLVLSSSGGGADDGLLEAREIVTMKLGTDLAVLSACETGRANSSFNGAGVIGLSWALLAAGCRTTVVSQWKAQSTATAALMIEFHRQLVHGASKPAALRNAQLALRRDPQYAHPFYWAPFVVLGAP
ncbi:MAG: hypothetical protein QOH21_1728 [Acidobacteriota bacterium]|jgi:CHAT domain-containing protein|nr:hypothetical protein [Acidobacteriota bacterium]